MRAYCRRKDLERAHAIAQGAVSHSVDDYQAIADCGARVNVLWDHLEHLPRCPACLALQGDHPSTPSTLELEHDEPDDELPDDELPDETDWRGPPPAPVDDDEIPF